MPNQDTNTTTQPSGRPPWAVTERADDILLKLLGLIEQDIDSGVLPSRRLEAYEALCRAEAARTGR